MQRDRLQRLGLLVVVAASAFDGAFELSISPALPSIRAELGASPTAITWVVTGYVLAAAVAIPLAGPLGNRFGRRRMLLLSLGAFTTGAAVCGLGNDIGVVILGRVIQGLGGGVGVLAIAISAERFSGDDVPKALQAIIGASALGGISGLLATGLLVDHVSASAVFWVVGGLSAATALAAWLLVDEGPTYTSDRVDVPGALLLGATLTAIMLAASKGNTWGWSSASVLGLLAGGVALAGVWVAWEHRVPSPLVDLRLMRRRSIWSATSMYFMVGFVFFSPMTLVALLAGYPTSTGFGLGLGGTSIALLLLPNAVGVLLGALVGRRLVARAGPRLAALLGAGLASCSYVALFALPSSTVALAGSLVPLGFGIGLAISAVLNIVVLASSASEVGVTSSLAITVRTVGQALGPQVAIAIAVSVPAFAPGVLAERGFERAFGFGLVASFAAILAACLLPRTRAAAAVVTDDEVEPGSPARRREQELAAPG